MADAFASRSITPELVRSDPVIQEALQNGEFNQQFLRGVNGLPFYMSMTAPTEDSSPIAFERNFNPHLKYDSEYFKNLNETIQCVERNTPMGLTPEEESKVCSKEFKKMRLSAFKNELLYHNVNKRFYMDMIQYKRHEAPF